MNKSVYFDIVRDGYQGFSFFDKNFYILFIIISVIFVLYEIYLIYKYKKITLQFVISIPTFAFAIYLALQFNSIFSDLEKSEYKNLSNSYKNKEYKTVEGKISKVSVMYGRINHQYFSINNVNFAISDNIKNGGFNKTILNKGPLYENVYAKIFYVEREKEKIIIRLEIYQ